MLGSGSLSPQTLPRLMHPYSQPLSQRQLFAGPVVSTPSPTPVSTAPIASGPSVTVFSLIFVLVGLAVVVIAGVSRFFWVRRQNEYLIDETNAQAARMRAARWFDVGEGIGAGGDGWGRPADRRRRIEKVHVRPRMGEVELNAGEKRLEKVEGSEPLTLTVPKANTRSPTPRLLLSVLVLAPSPPVPRATRPHEPDEEPELPEMEIGTVEIDLLLKGDFRSRVEWEQVKLKLREEDDKWNRDGG